MIHFSSSALVHLHGTLIKCGDCQAMICDSMHFIFSHVHRLKFFWDQKWNFKLHKSPTDGAKYLDGTIAWNWFWLIPERSAWTLREGKFSGEFRETHLISHSLNSRLLIQRRVINRFNRSSISKMRLLFTFHFATRSICNARCWCGCKSFDVQLSFNCWWVMKYLRNVREVPTRKFWLIYSLEFI